MTNGSPTFKRLWIPPVTLAAMIFIASTRSQVAGPPIANSDKMGHFAVFGMLATLVLRALCLRRAGTTLPRYATWIAVLLVSIYGMTDEWHQSFTPGRSVEVGDWLADTSGALLAVLLYAHWDLYRRCLEWKLPLRRKRRIENVTRVPEVMPP